MRIELCRRCGIELVPKQKCDVCREPIIFQCKKCIRETEEKIHLNCRLIDMDFKLLDSRAV